MGKRKFVLFFCLLLLISGCATRPTDPDELRIYEENNDPLEPMNRGVHAFNQAADKVVLKPIAKGYRAIVPKIIRTGISNFFDNLRQPMHMVNALLQGEFKNAGITLGRFTLNTIWGIGGLFDVATPAGVPEPGNDFGQTLAKWGWDGDGGPFIMLPFLGPSSVRDGIGTGVDAAGNPLVWILWDEPVLGYAATATDAISTREQVMDLLDNLEKSSTDYYATLRTMYRQNRRKKINPETTEQEQQTDEDYEAEFAEIEWED